MADTLSRRAGKPGAALREAHSESTRARIVDAAFALVEAGEEPTMRAVARAAGVGERTIYRYFETHDALALALYPRFRGRAGVPLPDAFDALPGYVRDLFATFDRNARLITTMDTAPWMLPHFEKTRRRNLDALRELVAAAFPEAPEEDRAAGASALRVVLSGAGWRYLRLSCSLSQEAVVEHALWVLETVATRLGAARAPRGRKRGR